jgi:hypothetical protein
MQRSIVLLLAAVLLGALAQAEDPRVPVIVELFTSEGCSSCPPADRLLARLEQTQPVPGAEVIALEEHVDYWNQLGWVDPFSSAQFRARQNDYAVAFHATDVYTPQMVVDGQAQFVGSDAGRAYHEISAAAQAPAVALGLAARPNTRDPELVDLTVRMNSPKNVKLRDSNLYLAVTESNLASYVKRGENAGHVVRHSDVVRSFGVIARVDPRGTNGGEVVSTLRLPHEWKRENLRAVVFLQERDSFHITGVSVLDLH